MWETKVLKEVNPNEKEKIGMSSFIMGQRNFSLATNATTKPSTLVEAIKDKNGGNKWEMNMWL